MKAIICVGVSASGKSTEAAKIVQESSEEWWKLDRDDLRFSMHCAKNWGGYKFNKNTERMITHIHDLMAHDAARLGINLIIAETNLGKQRDAWIKALEVLGYEVEIEEFPISLEEAIDRDSKRQYSVGESVIRQQYEKWIIYLENKPKDK